MYWQELDMGWCLLFQFKSEYTELDFIHVHDWIGLAGSLGGGMFMLMGIVPELIMYGRERNNFRTLNKIRLSKTDD